MKRLMIIAIGICLLLASVPAMADQAEDEAAIRKMVEKWYAALNSHDIKSALALADEDMENWSGTRNRAEMVERWTEVFATRFRNVKYEGFEEIGIRFVKPDVAVYKDRYDFSGAIDADGKTQPSSKWLNAWLLVKKNGKWVCVEFFQTRIEE